MRTNLAIALVAAASLVSSAGLTQAQAQVVGQAAPRARVAQGYVVEKASGGYLGIGGLDISPERAKALNLKEERGVEVSSLAESGPAAKAGIKDGDVVLEFNGQPVQGTAQFQRLVRAVTATVGENKQTMAMLAPEDGAWNFSMPSVHAMPNIEMPHIQISSQNPMLGIMGEPLGQEDQLAEFFGVQDGVLVRSVKKGSAADKAGIKAGDVITKVDDSKVVSSGEITRALRGVKSKKSLSVTVMRSKKEMTLTVTIETAGNTVQAGLPVVNC
jgi:serine protease Do